MKKKNGKFKFLYFLGLLLLPLELFAAEHTIEMLSSSDGQMMVFKPAVLKIDKGDTVKWISKNPGHNSAAIEEMIPKGFKAWNGKINEEISVKFTIEGIYGYKCTPHYILGMVGLIVVGNKTSNMENAKNFALEAEKKFATNKNRFTNYFSQIK
tara:strand:+ start:655 stop:1116 length:462 start_codon:yes stop_codon:yes gene_type:complete